MKPQNFGRRAERRVKYESRSTLVQYLNAITYQLPPDQGNFVPSALASSHVSLLYAGEFMAMVKSSGQHPLRIANLLDDTIASTSSSQKKAHVELSGLMLAGPKANKPTIRIADNEQLQQDRASIAKFALDTCKLTIHEHIPGITIGEFRNSVDPAFMEAAHNMQQPDPIVLGSVTLQTTRWNAPFTAHN